MRRLTREARTASALSHPNIAHIYELGEVDGSPYIAMEYVEGETLKARLARGRLNISEALGVAAQIASALSAAHQKGVIHRDLKPENVVIGSGGAIKVLDFGLAKLTEAAAAASKPGSSTLLDTEPGLIMGTVAYMSPEQARGEGDVDTRTDVWSLGVVLYEMLSGQLPFKGDTTSDVIASVLRSEPEPLAEHFPDTPDGLWRVVVRALKKDRDVRYGSVKELLGDLQRFDQLGLGDKGAAGSPEPRESHKHADEAVPEREVVSTQEGARPTTNNVNGLRQTTFTNNALYPNFFSNYISSNEYDSGVGNKPNVGGASQEHTSAGGGSISEDLMTIKGVRRGVKAAALGLAVGLLSHVSLYCLGISSDYAQQYYEANYHHYRYVSFPIPLRVKEFLTPLFYPAFVGYFAALTLFLFGIVRSIHAVIFERSDRSAG